MEEKNIQGSKRKKRGESRAGNWKRKAAFLEHTSYMLIYLSLAGLDNIATEGSQAFDTLEDVVDRLGNHGRFGCFPFHV